ncbi:uncharacterized protein LOC108095705 [Drosophila ficusphila]|uniref:uncharacterized protein LOC108095705 n=1 Tax=Drosophila ficusphila TaxID=30025 RepID=UPI0007E80EF3|nr:uncharacterized protein LOC108095705 [Drosophila ficusphila]
MGYFIKTFLATVAIIATVNVAFANDDRITIFGDVKPGATVFHKAEIVEPKKLLRVVKKTVFFKPQAHKIDAIRITDNSGHKGGTPALLDGGPGTNYAKIQFQSNRNHPLNFTLEYLGAPPSAFYYSQKI